MFCSCGAQKGVARWARAREDQPVGAKCFECGSTSKWRRDTGYTNAERKKREVKKNSIKTIKGMVEALRKATAEADQSLDECVADIDAILVEFAALENISRQTNNLEAGQDIE